MSLLCTGIIYFTEWLPSEEAYDDMSFFIQRKANDNRLNVSLGYNMSDYTETKLNSEEFKVYHKAPPNSIDLLGN